VLRRRPAHGTLGTRVSEILHLRASDSRRVPWKNGRGFTDELALWPAGASLERADFDWRISKAAVEENGPFSSFPGIERVLVVTEGAGVVLDHGARAPRATLEPLIPYRFSGDWPTSAELVAGRIADFNVLCRRALVRADVEVWTGSIARSLPPLSGEHVFAHVLEGELVARTGLERREARIAAGESLWVQGPEEVLELRLDAGAVIVVRLSPV
jgi:uncharacterized protein